MQDGHPIAYVSKALTTTARNYAQFEKKCVVIIFVCRVWSIYIYGRTMVTIRTDHKPIETKFRKHYWQHPNGYNACYWSYRSITSKCNIKEVGNANSRFPFSNIYRQQGWRTKTRAGFINKWHIWYGHLGKRGLGTSWDPRIYKSYWPTICRNSKAHKTRQSTAISENDDFSWMTRH